MMNNSYPTPILFIIFNRPDVTRQVFEQIKKMKPSYLFIAADGPRSERPSDKILCQETRKIIDEVDWNCEVKTLLRNENLGCGFAVCSAISWFFEHVNAGIILEDDCYPDTSFFPFCTELLDKYKDDNDIYVVSGTNMQNGNKRGNSSYYFSYYPLTWGWASWRRAWDHFNYDIPEFDQTFKSGRLDHVYQSFQEKLYWRNKVKKGETEKKYIWDYQWYYAIWKNKGIGITPNKNLIVNIGLRNAPTHTFLNDSIREPSTTFPMQFPLIHPEKKIDRVADQFTFKNAYSHSVSRLFRLIRENGFLTIMKYTIDKFV